MATNLTKQDLKQGLAGLAKQFDKKLDQRISPLEKVLQEMSVTLKQTTALLTHVVEDVDTLKSDMKSVKTTLNDHTITLDAIYKNSEITKTENAAFKATIERHERWFEQIAAKIHIELER